MNAREGTYQPSTSRTASRQPATSRAASRQPSTSRAASRQPSYSRDTSLAVDNRERNRREGSHQPFSYDPSHSRENSLPPDGLRVPSRPQSLYPQHRHPSGSGPTPSQSNNLNLSLSDQVSDRFNEVLQDSDTRGRSRYRNNPTAAPGQVEDFNWVAEDEFDERRDSDYRSYSPGPWSNRTSRSNSYSRPQSPSLASDHNDRDVQVQNAPIAPQPQKKAGRKARKAEDLVPFFVDELLDLNNGDGPQMRRICIKCRSVFSYFLFIIY